MSQATEQTETSGSKHGEKPQEIGHDEIEREIGHDEYDPVGTAVLVFLYFVIISLMWVFMYFVEFLGNGPTVV